MTPWRKNYPDQKKKSDRAKRREALEWRSPRSPVRFSNDVEQMVRHGQAQDRDAGSTPDQKREHERGDFTSKSLNQRNCETVTDNKKTEGYSGREKGKKNEVEEKKAWERVLAGDLKRG